METTKLSSKGQIIIPRVLRDEYNWKPGLEFIIIDTGHGVLLRPKRAFPATTLEQVAGSLSYSGPAKTITEMDAAIEQAVREQWHGRS